MKIFITIIFTLIFAGFASAGGYTTGKQTGSCSFTPLSTVEGNYVTVNATGLPVNKEINLFILNYETITRQYQSLVINSDGTYSGQYQIIGDKYSTFQFTSPNTKSSTRLAQNDATCKIWADSE